MNRHILLRGELCALAVLEPEDALAWSEWFNDLDVALPLGDEAYSPTGVDAMREGVRSALAAGDPVFSIIRNEDGALIGRCLLFAVNRVDRTAMAGIAIGDKSAWGQGFGREAFVLLLDYAFNLLNLHSVMLGVFSFNERAAASYRAIGFREIGRRRHARWIGGQPYDGILMDILEDEFRALHPSRVTQGRIPQIKP